MDNKPDNLAQALQNQQDFGTPEHRSFFIQLKIQAGVAGSALQDWIAYYDTELKKDIDEQVDKQQSARCKPKPN